MDIRKQFTAKYGKEFVTAAVELRPDSGVSRTLIEKLSANPPDGPTKVKILTGIAEEHKIKWEPNWFKDNEPEPPVYLQNGPDIDKISKMHVEPQNLQAASRFEPKPDIPSNVHHVAESEVYDPKFAYSAARPSGGRTVQGAEPETVDSNQSYGGVENSSFVARQKWNMEFKDASSAAHAAAESAELASMAARAAAELASCGKFTDYASADSTFAQNEGSRVHSASADQQGGCGERYSTDNSLRERPSRMEHVQRDPNLNVVAPGVTDENNFNKQYHRDRPYTSQQSISPMKAMENDGNQPYTGKRRTSEVSLKENHRQSFERYDEVQDVVEIEEQHDSSPEDSEHWKSTSSSRVASKYEHEIFHYPNRHEDDSAENPFYGEAVKTRNQPSIYHSQSSGLGENYGIMRSSDPPKFDDDLDEDPFDSTGRGVLYKEDLEGKEPSEEFAFNTTVSHDWKDDVLAFSEQRKYAFESQKHLFAEGDDDSRHMEKDSNNTSINDAAPHFDDYVADEDDFIHSPRRRSPEYSSPDEERFPKKFGISSSKHSYQPELTESFKNSPIYSQLVKPISLGDDSDGASSENDEGVTNSETHEITSTGNVLYNHKNTEAEHRDPDEFVGSSYSGRRGTSIISEDSTAIYHSGQSLEEDSSAYIRKKSGSGDLLTRQQSPGRTRSRSNAKSYDRESFSRLLEEAERLSSPRRSPLQATADEIDASQDNYVSNSQSNFELNVASLSGGLKNKGYRCPPYTKGISAYSPSSTISAVDDAPKESESSTLSSSEIKEPCGKKESIHKKKTQSYFDADVDDSVEDADWKGSIRIQNSSEKEILDNSNQRSSSGVPQSYLDSEDISSGEEGVKQTVPNKYRSGAGFSRRTRLSGQSHAAGAQTETRSSYKSPSALESVSEKETSSSTSFGVDYAVKPMKANVIQMESLEPRRREENKTRPSHLSKISSGEEISAPSAAGKQATGSKVETSGAEMADSSANSLSSTDKTLLRESSDKKASHVHPKLPDYDNLAFHMLSLRKNRQ